MGIEIDSLSIRFRHLLLMNTYLFCFLLNKSALLISLEFWFKSYCHLLIFVHGRSSFLFLLLITAEGRPRSSLSILQLRRRHCSNSIFATFMRLRD